ASPADPRLSRLSAVSRPGTAGNRPRNPHHGPLTTPTQSHLLPGPHAAGSPQDGNPQCLYPDRVDYARKSTAPTPADAHHRGPPVTGAPGIRVAGKMMFIPSNRRALCAQTAGSNNARYRSRAYAILRRRVENDQPVNGA